MRHIAVFDLETTSANTNDCRICQIAILICTFDLKPLGPPMVSLVNPQIPIPAEATAVHGITDEMVKDAPTFEMIAPSLVQILDPTDWATYNGIKFDCPVILNEFNRVGITIDITGKKLIDGYIVFTKKEPRTLIEALRFYCGKELENAHDAGGDAMATFEVLLGQIAKYDDLNTVDDLVALTEPENRCDLAGKIVMKDGVPVFNFGTKFGKPISDDIGMLNWILDKDFPAETKQWVTKYLRSLENGNS